MSVEVVPSSGPIPMRIGGRSSAVISLPRAFSTARCTALSSSRTFPGQP